MHSSQNWQIQTFTAIRGKEVVEIPIFKTDLKYNFLANKNY